MRVHVPLTFKCRATSHEKSGFLLMDVQARWDISLNVPSEYTALSNMDEISATPDQATGMTLHQYGLRCANASRQILSSLRT